MTKQHIPKSFDVMLYPELDDMQAVGFYPPLDIAEMLAKTDELSEQEELTEFESGVLFAVEKLMAVPAINFLKECSYLLEDILAPHSNRPIDEPDDDEIDECAVPASIPVKVTKDTTWEDVLPPIPKDKSLTIITPKEKETTMIAHNKNNPNGVTIEGVYIRDKNSPSQVELDNWYMAKKGFSVANWVNLMYYHKKEHFVKQEEAIFGKKTEKKTFFAAPERDFTDEEMLEMLHTKEDDIIEGKVQPDPVTTVVG